MRVLALEPYYGGSHQAFLDGWTRLSRHDWTVLRLPPHNWKWRMRHSALYFKEAVSSLVAAGDEWDLLFCSDMLGLAEFLGLAPPVLRNLPALVYFHENQLTYPVKESRDRDYHFAFTNMTTALAADKVWFNSHFHMHSFLRELRELLTRMPDHQPTADLASIRTRAEVRHPCIESFPERTERQPGPARILWAARWEDEKGPADLFKALVGLEKRGMDFRISIVGGGNARNVPSVFEEAKRHFAGKIDHWGYQQSRVDYRNVLSWSDIVVSTAYHEFFGIGVVEAIAAGAFPLLPDRQAYPEVLGIVFGSSTDSFLYDGTVDDLEESLAGLIRRLECKSLWSSSPMLSPDAMKRLLWETVVPEWDNELEHI